MILGYSNYVDSATVNANSEDSGYPVTNVQDQQLGKVYRSTGVSGEWLKFDLGSAEDVQGVFVVGHNITSGATVKVQANSSDDFASPPVDVSMTYGDIIYYLFSSSQSYRYWRITIDDSGNSDGYIEIGRVHIGKMLELGDIIKAEYPETIKRTDKIQFSLTGQVFGDEGVAYRLWTFNLPHLTLTEKNNLEEVFSDVGKINPLILIVYEDDINDYGIKYVVFNDDISFNHIFGDIWNCNIAFREVL